MVKKRLYKALIYALLVLVSFVLLFPVLMMISTSLFSEADMLEIPRRLLPTSANWSNFTEVFKVIGRATDDWGREKGYLLAYYIRNSFLVVVLYVVGCVLSASLCAYGFSKVKFKGRDAVFMLVMMSMMIPGSVTIISLYRIYKTLGMIDTLLPLWLPIWFGGGATNIFLLRQIMRGYPDEVLESASIDGAGHLRKLFVLVIPSVVPMLIYIAVTSALAVWNDFQTPLLYIYKKELWTIARGVAAMVTTKGISGNHVTTQHLMFTACAIMSVFPLVLFAVGQKYFMESVSLAGVKG